MRVATFHHTDPFCQALCKLLGIEGRPIHKLVLSAEAPNQFELTLRERILNPIENPAAVTDTYRTHRHVVDLPLTQYVLVEKSKAIELGLLDKTPSGISDDGKAT